MWKRAQVKRGYNCADFHETPICTSLAPNLFQIRLQMWKSAQVKRGYNCADFHEPPSHKINGEILYRILWKSNEKRRKYEKRKYSCLFVKCGFQCSDFHKNSSILSGPAMGFIRRTSLKWTDREENCWHKFIYAPK